MVLQFKKVQKYCNSSSPTARHPTQTIPDKCLSNLFSKDSSTGDFHPKPPRQVLQAVNYLQILLVSKLYLNNCDSSPFLVLPNVNMEIRLFPSSLWGTFMCYWQDVITSFIHLPQSEQIIFKFSGPKNILTHDSFSEASPTGPQLS